MAVDERQLTDLTSGLDALEIAAAPARQLGAAALERDVAEGARDRDRLRDLAVPRTPPSGEPHFALPSPVASRSKPSSTTAA